MKQKYLISIVGTTGIGKTALSIQLAIHFKTVILSSDSRQFYKEMSIGTAVPDKEDLERIKHYFIQNRSVVEDYSVGDFEREALETLEFLLKKHDIIVMVGGSGLYSDALINGLDDFPDVDSNIRERLKLQLEENGIESLQDQLRTLDHEAFQKIDIQNKQRLIRALEICIGTGQPYTSFLNKKKNDRPFRVIKIGITADRQVVYDRINKRVDGMMQSGLLEEVKELQSFSNLNSLQTVGYKELFKYLDNECSLDQAIEEIKKNTRRFAKRQGTWFRKDKEIKWFEFPPQTNEVIYYIEDKTV